MCPWAKGPGELCRARVRAEHDEARVHHLVDESFAVQAGEGARDRAAQLHRLELAQGAARLDQFLE
jgi:hypothetical protein